MLYFSYGSNMSSKRLQHRLPSARRIGVAVLVGHELRFHKVSKKDGSAKCDACRASDCGREVIGVLFDISVQDKTRLDEFEGLGNGYEQKPVTVIFDGKGVEAFTYYATITDAQLKPFHWYKEHVLRGARENDFPLSYIRQIETVESIDDADSQRHVNELSIYG